MRLLLDTNRYTDLARGLPDVVSSCAAATELWLSLISLGELRAGFAGGTKNNQNEVVFQRFLAKPTTGILYLDETTTNFYAALHVQLRSAGTPIPANDLWIAALAIQHDLTLDTRDRHFLHVPGLKLVNAS